MKIMAVDYGDAHTGIAISDETGSLAGFSTVIDQWNVQKTLEEICRLAVQHKVEHIVVGRPLNMNGTAGERAEKAQQFCTQLAEMSGLPTVMWDERRTSVDANRILSDNGKKRKKQKRLVDAVAAALILEGYLTYRRNHPES